MSAGEVQVLRRHDQPIPSHSERHGARWTYVRIAAAILVAALLGMTFCIFGTMRELLFNNSDLLQVSDWVHVFLTHPRIITDVQISRSPSFLPDLLVVTVLSAVVPSWQWVMVAYAGLSLAAIVYLGGLIASRLADRPLDCTVAVMCSLSVLLVLLDLAILKDTGFLITVLLPLIHAGSLIYSLAGLVWGRVVLKRGTAASLFAIFLFTIAGVLSDKLFVGSFVLPFAVAGTVMALSEDRQGTLRGRLAPVGVVLAGCVFGFGVDHVLFSTVLDRFEGLNVSVADIPNHLAAMVIDMRFYVGLVFVCIILFAPLVLNGTSIYWRLVSSVTGLGFLALLVLVWGNQYSGRYMQAISWWSIIMLVAVGSQAASRRLPSLAFLAAALLFGVMIATGRSSPSFAGLTRTRPPLVSCLWPLVQNGKVHTGVAGFWVARPTKMWSDWKVPLLQVQTDGMAYIWGNSRRDYFWQGADPADRVLIDYAVLDYRPGLDRLHAEVALERYGPPTSEMACGAYQVWFYSRPGGVNGAVTANLKAMPSR